jgi:hypothetical protein
LSDPVIKRIIALLGIATCAVFGSWKGPSRKRLPTRYGLRAGRRPAATCIFGNAGRATGSKPLCLLINFGKPKVEIRRNTAQA